MNKLHYNGPVVLAILDGVGLRESNVGNAVAAANLPFLKSAIKNYLNIPLAASGPAVGVLSGQMGNSEVGHRTLGSGQVIKQEIARVEDAFASGEIWKSESWNTAINQAQNHTLHFCGIFSDGGVHSKLSHLKKMIQKANASGVKKIRIHCIFDGRDVNPQSEPKYINEIEEFFAQYSNCDYKIASGGGRMVFVADRYEADWKIVEQGWEAIVHGLAPRKFKSAKSAIETFREENPSIQDQYLPAFVVVDKNNEPVGKVENGDAFIYFDFRADRAVEISSAFTLDDFSAFDRKENPDVYFVGLTEYDHDRHIPEHVLVPPLKISDTLSSFLSAQNISQFAVTETVKFGHITYYFNGNSYEKNPAEVHQEIRSDDVPFNQQPAMKSAEIADAVIENLSRYDFIRCNFPGGDMVGHLGDMPATITALEAIDAALSRIAKKVDELGGILLITADHGNAEELQNEDGSQKTSHTLNPVACIFYDNSSNRNRYKSANVSDPGLSNIAATIAILLGIEESSLPSCWRQPLISVL